MKWCVRILCTQVRDLSTAVTLRQDTSSAFFLNCPNSLTRMIDDNSFPKPRSYKFILQSLRHEHFGGFPPLYYERAHFSRRNFLIEVHGPRGLEEYMKSFRMAYGTEGAKWSASDFLFTNKDEEVSMLDIKNKTKIIPVQMDSKDTFLSYIVEVYEQPKSLNDAKVKHLKLTPMHIEQLTAGNSITLENGKVVTPDEVHCRLTDSLSLMFIYAKTMENVQFLTESKKAAEYLEGKSPAKRVSLMYHTTSLEVLKDPRYLNFLEQFGQHVHHVIDCKELIEDENMRLPAHYFTKVLHTVNSRIFPAASSQGFHTVDKAAKLSILNEFMKRGLKVSIAAIGRNVPLRLEEEKVVFKQKISEIATNNHKAVRDMIEDKQNLKKIWTTCENIKSTKRFKNEPFIVFLGTASMKTTKYRAASGIYINVPGNTEKAVDPRISPSRYKNSFGILADCGEGAYGQMTDHFLGSTGDILRNLRVIFITHFHGDHVFGLGQVVEEAEKALLEVYTPRDAEKVKKEAPLYIVVPENILLYMRLTLNLVCPYFKARVRLIPIFNLNPCRKYFFDSTEEVRVPPIPEGRVEELIADLYLTAGPGLKEFIDYLKSVMGIQRLHSFETQHTVNSHGMVLNGPDWKVIYTGDTMPNAMLDNFIYKTDLLIHECTFVNNIARKAECVKHTSQKEITEIVRRLKPWRTILTHFSQTDMRIARLSQEAIDEKIFAAYDHLQFNLSDAEWIYKLVPIFEKVITNNFINCVHLDRAFKYSHCYFA
eukprot:TRINITY_DN9444_c0_g3_i7.p1 TRINITY_DN9444_c0_g3~~TRINITY_DN9444_c0_g3_i7.p1  ORF type:complete len:764 (+),score=105.19 TRINITY_DN9444_c0_g3_i7:152-2443(+)